MDGKVPTEAQEHRLFVAYLRDRGFKFTHVANETGTSNKWIGVRNKQNGVSPGFPDFLIVVKDRLCAVEIKRQKKAWATREQIDWLAALAACGVEGRVCKGYELSKAFIEELEEKYGKDKQVKPGAGSGDTELYSEMGQPGRC